MKKTLLMFFSPHIRSTAVLSRAEVKLHILQIDIHWFLAGIVEEHMKSHTDIIVTLFLEPDMFCSVHSHNSNIQTNQFVI